ncbi:DUF2510 domain-containing protein [Actinokineospora auranticolor]|nr:DUF2510 domain-containing protein [Actinokineospora auranticolor]
MNQTTHRPAGWFVDPMDGALLRYWDGHRWTFHTDVRPVPEPAEPVAQEVPVLRPDVAAALGRVKGMLVGSMKEVRLPADYLQPEERVLALTGAMSDGTGVLRLLFLFVGLLRRQFLEVGWSEAREVCYHRDLGQFAVYTTKRTKRAVPALSVKDAEAIANAAVAASAAPRLDVVD